MERSEEQKEADQFGALASVLQENIELRKLCLKISKLPADRLALIQQLVDTMTP